MTIENTDMRLWFADRSIFVKSTPINFLNVSSNYLVHTFSL